ncbi:MAG: ATP synthase subunit I [Clostridia bacterium]|nr:ATP synthase subunit I [Clostridia bacterium]
MVKIDKTVLKETRFIAIGVIILSVLMESVFLILMRWNYKVLLGNILSGTVAILNFFLMGVTVQKAVKKDEKQAANTMRLSQTVRNALMFVVAAIGVLAPIFNTITVLIPLFFPRITIMLRPIFMKKNDKEL